jgi:hypothetical protein
LGSVKRKPQLLGLDKDFRRHRSPWVSLHTLQLAGDNLFRPPRFRFRNYFRSYPSSPWMRNK